MDKLQKLYDSLVGRGLYSKSYEEFVAQFSSDEKQEKLHKVLMDKSLYSKSFDDFKGQFFGSTQVKEEMAAKDNAEVPEVTTEETKKKSSASEEYGAPFSKKYNLTGSPEFSTEKDDPNYVEPTMETTGVPEVKTPGEVRNIKDLKSYESGWLEDLQQDKKGFYTKASEVGLEKTASSLSRIPEYFVQNISFALMDDEEKAQYADVPEEERMKYLDDFWSFGKGFKNAVGATAMKAATALFTGGVFSQSMTSVAKRAQPFSDRMLAASEETIKTMEGFDQGIVGAESLEQGIKNTVASALMSAPMMLVGAIPGVGLGVIGVATAADELDRMEKEGKPIDGYSLGTAAVNGVAEAFFEKYTQRILGKNWKKFMGEEVLSKLAGKSIIKTLFTQLGIEGGSEVATELIQSTSESIFRGEKVDMNQILKQMADAGITGAFMGGVMGGVGAAKDYSTMRMMTEDELKIHNDTYHEVLNLKAQQKGSANKDAIQRVIDKKVKFLEDFKNVKWKQIEGLNFNDKKEVVELSQEIDALKEAAADENIDPAVKKGLLRDAEVLERKRQTMLIESGEKGQAVRENFRSTKKALEEKYGKSFAELKKNDFEDLDEFELRELNKQSVESSGVDLFGKAKTKSGKDVYMKSDVKEATPEEFIKAQKKGLEERKKKGAESKTVDILSKEEAETIIKDGGKLLLTEDGKAGGFVLSDGYMGGLFKSASATKAEAANAIQQASLENKDVYFDAYATPKLDHIYKKNGFVKVAEIPFDETMAPEGWENDPHLSKKPNVAFYAYDPKNANKSEPFEVTQVDTYEAGLAMAKHFKDDKKGVTTKPAENKVTTKPTEDKTTTTETESVDTDVIKNDKINENDTQDVVEKKLKSKVAKAKKAISKIIPGIKFEILDSKELSKRIGKSEEFSREIGGVHIYKDGKHVILLNKDAADNKTITHEVFHAVLREALGGKNATTEYVAKASKSLLGSIKTAVQKSKNQALKDKFKEISKFVDDVYNDKSVLDEEKMATLAEFIGEVYKLPDNTVKQKIKDFVNNLVAKILMLGDANPDLWGEEFGPEAKLKTLARIANYTDEGKELTWDHVKEFNTPFDFDESDVMSPPETKFQKKAHELVKKVRSEVVPGKKVSRGLIKKGSKYLPNNELTVEAAKKNAPDFFIKSANFLRTYDATKSAGKFREAKTVNQAEKIINSFVEVVEDNLMWIISKFKKDYVEVSTLWYDGANRIAREMADEYGVTPEQAAAVIASMSPQKDWYQNVQLGKFVLDAFKADPVITQSMIDFQIQMRIKSMKSGGKKTPAAMKHAIAKMNEVTEVMSQYIGKKLSEVPETVPSKMSKIPHTLQAYIVRTYNEMLGRKDYNVLLPTGDVLGIAVSKKTGKKIKLAWGSYVEVGKAVSVVNNGSMDNLEVVLGHQHKIRNFHNNIIDPNSDDGSVTIDTHAVAAGLLKPLGGNTWQVKANFGTGNSASTNAFGYKGLYFAYAQAYQNVADRLGILPRQVQSIAWEAVRGLFPDDAKTKKDIAKIDAIWEKRVKGEITLKELQDEIYKAADGIEDPTWASEVENFFGNKLGSRTTVPGNDVGVTTEPGNDSGDRGDVQGGEVKYQHIKRTGEQNVEFFTEKAKNASSDIPYKHVVKIPETPVSKAYGIYSAQGNFTGHISKMIAGFEEKQIRVAEAIVKGPYKSFLDIGASEGGLVKTVVSQKKGVRGVAVDPNLDMYNNFKATPEVPGAEYVTKAYQGSWVEDGNRVVEEFKTNEKFDVINEDFTFQFINNGREKQVAGVAKMLNKNGIFVTSEKFIDTKNYEKNEKKKYDHQKKYFDAAALKEDKETIVSGMASDMVNDVDYFNTLGNHFRYVEEFWNSGNFKGYIASNSLKNLRKFKADIGDLTTEFTDKESLTSPEYLKSKEGIKYQIIGKNAILSYQTREFLADAVAMEEGGTDPKIIRLNTGWEKGKDNMWRYEVADNLEAWESNLEEILIEQDGERKMVTRLGELVPTSLLRHYPSLINIKVTFKDDARSAEGWAGYNYIFVNTKRTKSYQWIPILLHETQHIIQGIEGFTRGGSPSMKTKKGGKDLERYDQLLSDLMTSNFDLYAVNAEEFIAIARRETRRSGIKVPVGLVNPIIKYLKSKDYEGIIKEPKKLAELIELHYTVQSTLGYDRYLKLAGEVEARNVEERRLLTKTQRSKFMLSETESVAREDQILVESVRYQKKVMRQSDKAMAKNREYMKDQESKINALNTYLKTGEKWRDGMDVWRGKSGKIYLGLHEKEEYLDVMENYGIEVLTNVDLVEDNRSFYGDSVDPLKFYRGTSEFSDKYDNTRGGRFVEKEGFYNSQSGFGEYGYFLSTNPNVAKVYANLRGEGTVNEYYVKRGAKVAALNWNGVWDDKPRAGDISIKEVKNFLNYKKGEKVSIQTIQDLAYNRFGYDMILVDRIDELNDVGDPYASRAKYGYGYGTTLTVKFSEGEKNILQVSEEPAHIAFQLKKKGRVPKGKVVKTIIRKNTGQRDLSKIVKSTEAKELKRRFKAMEKASIEGAKAMDKTKGEFINYVKSLITKYAKDNVITDNEVKRMLETVRKAKDPATIRKQQDVVNKIISAILKRQFRKKYTTELKKLVSKAKKNAIKRYGRAGANIMKLSVIPVDLIPVGPALIRYYNVMKAMATGKELDFYELNEIYEFLKGDIAAYAEAKYEESKKEKEIDPKIEAKIEDELKELEDAVNSLKNIDESNLTDYEIEILRALRKIPFSFFETLSRTRVRELTRAIGVLSQTGVMFNKVLNITAEMYKAKLGSDNILNKIGDAILRPLNMAFPKLWRSKKLVTEEQFTSKFYGTMLQHIDMLVSKIKGTPLYDNVIHPLTSAFNSSDVDTSHVASELGALLNKAINSRLGMRHKRILKTTKLSLSSKPDYGFDLNVIMQLLFRQWEVEGNPEWLGKKVFLVKDHMEALKKNWTDTGMSKETVDRIFEIYDMFKNPDGSIDVDKIYNYMTIAEINLVYFMRENLDKTKIMSQEINDQHRGESLIYLRSYFPRKNAVTGLEDSDLPSVADNLNKVVGTTTTKQGASKARTAGANPLSFNTMSIFMNHIKEANLEYRVTGPLKRVGMVLSNLKKSQNESVRILASALEKTVKSMVESQLGNSIYTPKTKMERFFNLFTRRTYTRMLIDPVRLSYDMASNWIPVYAAYADKLPVLAKASKKLDKNVIQKITDKFSSTQIERLGGSRTIDMKEALSSSVSKAKYKEVNPSFFTSAMDFMSMNLSNDFANRASELYYKYADAPSMHIWKLTLWGEFDKLTGSEIDTDKLLNDKNYLIDNKDAFEKAIAKADKATTNLFNTGAASEQKLKIQLNRKDFLTRFNFFMRSFTSNESAMFWDSLKSMFGHGSMTKAEAARVFTIVNIRGVMYGFLAQSIIPAMAGLFGDEEEDEEVYDKALARSLGQHAQLILMGNNSALYNIVAASVFEYAHKKVHNANVEKYGGKKYNSYQDSYLYTIPQYGSLSSYLGSAGAEGYALKAMVDASTTTYKIFEKFAETGELSEEDRIKLKTIQVYTSFISQLTGLPFERTGKTVQKYYKNRAAANKKLKKKKTKEAAKKLLEE